MTANTKDDISLAVIANDIHHVKKSIDTLTDELKQQRRQTQEQQEKFEKKMEEKLATKADASRVEKIENNLSWAIKIVLAAVFMAVIAGVIYTARTPNIPHEARPAISSKIG